MIEKVPKKPLPTSRFCFHSIADSPGAKFRRNIIVIIPSEIFQVDGVIFVSTKSSKLDKAPDNQIPTTTASITFRQVVLHLKCLPFNTKQPRGEIVISIIYSSNPNKYSNSLSSSEDVWKIGCIKYSNISIYWYSGSTERSLFLAIKLYAVLSHLKIFFKVFFIWEKN